jgi:hypothetical protein
MFIAGIEPTFPASKRLPTHALNRAAARMGLSWVLLRKILEYAVIFTSATTEILKRNIVL